MKFTTLDLQSWPRGQMFYYFSKMAPTGYSITANIDVTNLREVLKQRQLKFFPAYLWLVTRNLNKQQEFKVAEKDGQLGYYDELTPLYAHFHQDSKLFSLMWTEYNDNFMEFYRAYLENQKNFGHNRGVLSQPETPPPANAYTVSCVPWISFSHFAVHSYENKPYYFPSVEAGKFYQERGTVNGQEIERTIMPVSLTCHHATTDGYHVNRFLEDLQKDMDGFSACLK